MAKIKYSTALTRLQEISTILEGEIEDINQVSELVKESAKLLAQCKKQLRDTEKDIENTLNKLDEPLA